MTLTEHFNYVVFPILTLAVCFALIRLLRGPDIVDRVIALDLVITIGIAAITAFSIISFQAVFLDVAMILALIAFLGTIAFSYYIHKKNNND
jgi:multicomponent Na+:H+ antiporter subunit F